MVLFTSTFIIIARHSGIPSSFRATPSSVDAPGASAQMTTHTATGAVTGERDLVGKAPSPGFGLGQGSLTGTAVWGPWACAVFGSGPQLWHRLLYKLNVGSGSK